MKPRTCNLRFTIYALAVAFCLWAGPARAAYFTNEINGVFNASSYDTDPHHWSDTFACYFYCANPTRTNHIYSWSRSGSSWNLDYTDQEQKWCLPFEASWNVPGYDWILPNDNGGYVSNDIVQWGTNIFAGPPVFWDGTSATNEGIATIGVTHIPMGGIPHDSTDGDSGAISRQAGSEELAALYSVPKVALWDMLWTNGVNTDQPGARLFGFDAGGHPWQAGLLGMTLWSIVALAPAYNYPTNFGSMVFNWSGASASTNSCVVSGLIVSGNTLTATVHFDMMPPGWDVPDGTITNDARACFTVFPMLAQFFTWTLQVTNLPTGNYNVAIDGSNVVTLSASQLAAGWNMFTNYNGSLWAQRKEVLGRKRDQEGLDRVTLLSHSGGSVGVLGVGDLVNFQGQADLQYVTDGKRGSAYTNAMATSVANMQAYDTNIWTAAQQTNHTFTITKQQPRFGPFHR